MIDALVSLSSTQQFGWGVIALGTFAFMIGFFKASPDVFWGDMLSEDHEI